MGRESGWTSQKAQQCKGIWETQEKTEKKERGKAGKLRSEDKPERPSVRPEGILQARDGLRAGGPVETMARKPGNSGKMSQMKKLGVVRGGDLHMLGKTSRHSRDPREPSRRMRNKDEGEDEGTKGESKGLRGS